MHPSPTSAVTVLLGLLSVSGCAANRAPTPTLARPSADLTPPPLPDDPEVAELHAFAELLGVVRFYHPSDEAAQTAWQLFTMHGIETLLQEPGLDPAAIQGLFAPIAPTVQVAAGAPPSPIALPEQGDRLVAWGHEAWGASWPMSDDSFDFRTGRLDWSVEAYTYKLMLWRSVSLERTPARWRITVEVEGAPNDSMEVAMFGIGKAGRLSYDSAVVRPAGGDTPAVLVLERAAHPELRQLRFYLTPLILREITLRKVKVEVSDAAGEWTELDLPLELTDDASAGWKKSGDPIPESTEAGLRFARPGEYTLEQPFEFSTEPGAVWQGPIGGGLSATVPLALPADADHTWPRGISGEAEAAWRATLSLQQPGDRASRVIRAADVIDVWTLLRHFHPHPDITHLPWEVMLDEALYSALHQPEIPLPEVVRTMLAAIPDGHIWVRDNAELLPFTCPLRLAEVDGRAFVVTSAMEALQPGDELLAFRGVPTRAALDREHALVSGTDHQRRTYALDNLRRAPGDVLPVRIRRGAELHELDLSCGSYVDEEYRHPPFEVLEDGVVYADLRRPGVFTPEAIETLARAPGYIIDLRGYPTSNPLLDHLTPPDTEGYHGWATTPTRTKPFSEPLSWIGTGYAPSHAEPLLDAPAAWLLDAHAISWSESMLGWARHHDPDVRFFGATPSSGANGVRLEMITTANLQVGFTSMRATLIDGTPMYARGHDVDERTPLTPAAARAGRDLEYEAALEWLRGDGARAPMLGSWQAADGSLFLVTREAIAIADASRWLGRLPILEWTAQGGTTCEQGLRVEQAMSMDGDHLRLRYGGEELQLTRLDSTPEPLKQVARVLIEPPPPVSAQAATVVVDELALRARAVPDRQLVPAALNPDNQAWLYRLVERYGWIDPDRFGVHAARDAAKLVLHSGDLSLMIAFAGRMEGVADLAQAHALLADRIAVQLGERQRYGTQLRRMPDARLVVLPVVDADAVHSRRRALGLDARVSALAGVEVSTLPVLDCSTLAPTE